MSAEKNFRLLLFFGFLARKQALLVNSAEKRFLEAPFFVEKAPESNRITLSPIIRHIAYGMRNYFGSDLAFQKIYNYVQHELSIRQ